MGLMMTDETNLIKLFGTIIRLVAYPGRIVEEKHKIRAGMIFLALQEYYPDVDFEGYLVKRFDREKLNKMGMTDEDFQKYSDIDELRRTHYEELKKKFCAP